MTGIWRDGLKNGDVTIEYQNGDRFQGFCLDDRIVGEGELVCKNGFVYKGQWKDNLVACLFFYFLIYTDLYNLGKVHHLDNSTI